MSSDRESRSLLQPFMQRSQRMLFCRGYRAPSRRGCHRPRPLVDELVPDVAGLRSYHQ
jgi:hypothetical protein